MHLYVMLLFTTSGTVQPFGPYSCVHRVLQAAASGQDGIEFVKEDKDAGDPAREDVRGLVRGQPAVPQEAKAKYATADSSDPTGIHKNRAGFAKASFSTLPELVLSALRLAAVRAIGGWMDYPGVCQRAQSVTLLFLANGRAHGWMGHRVGPSGHAKFFRPILPTSAPQETILSLP